MKLISEEICYVFKWKDFRIHWRVVQLLLFFFIRRSHHLWYDFKLLQVINEHLWFMSNYMLFSSTSFIKNQSWSEGVWRSAWSWLESCFRSWGKLSVRQTHSNDIGDIAELMLFVTLAVTLYVLSHIPNDLLLVILVTSHYTNRYISSDM